MSCSAPAFAHPRIIRRVLRFAAFVAAVAAIGGAAFAEPPPWAPAHGLRAKQGRTGEIVRLSPFATGGEACDRERLARVVREAVEPPTRATTLEEAVLEVLRGGDIGAVVRRIERNCLGAVLAGVPEGRIVAWEDARGPSRRHRVNAVRSYIDSRGRPCRVYRAWSAADGRVGESFDTACREPDGSWRVLD
jgi:surface antigen